VVDVWDGVAPQHLARFVWRGRCIFVYTVDDIDDDGDADDMMVMIRTLRWKMQSFFGFGASPKVELELSDTTERRMKKVDMVDGPPQHLFIFDGKEVLRGSVVITVPPGKKLEHLGIKVELKGSIGETKQFLTVSALVPLLFKLSFPVCESYTELYYDRGNPHEFINLPIQLASAGELTGSQVVGVASVLWWFSKFLLNPCPS
jgi:hypothetical protein